MTKKLKPTLLFFACFAFISAFIGIGFAIDSNYAKAVELNLDSEIFSSYSVGSEFTVPKGTIAYDGSSYDATAILIFPDGTPYAKNVYDLNSTGLYTLSYETVVNGKILSAEKTFNVYPKAYDVGANAVLEYRDALERVKGNTVSGIYVSLPENDVFKFNEPVNIYDFDAETPLICFHPFNEGGDGTTYRQSLRQVVRLTDCYDPDNYIDFILSWDYANHIIKEAALFYRASVAGGKAIGLRSTTDNNGFEYKNQYYSVRTTQYGACVPQYRLTDAGVTVYFDPIENTFYAKGTSKILVSKLDSYELYGDNAFSGFSTGEVFISVFAEEYYESVVEIEISMIAGYEQSELHLNSVSDTKNPNIVLDLDNADRVFYVAKNEEVVLPKVIVHDVNLIDEISVSVYSNYGTENCRQFSCSNGVFIPKTEGFYTVIYKAKDVFGNEGVKTLLLSCVETENGRSIDFSVEELDKLTAGTVCKLPVYTASSLNGNVSVKEFYSFGNGSERIPVSLDGFLVENVGQYLIVYEYTDGFLTYEKKYTVISEASGEITFDPPVLPEYLIANASYTFDKVYAYSYEGVYPVRHEVTVHLIKDGNESSATEIDYESVKIPNCTEVSFKYSFGGNSVYSIGLPVIDVDFGNDLLMENYFVGDFDKSSTGSSVYYSSKTTSGSNTLKFINTLSLSSFSFDFYVDEGFANFNSVDVCLTDFYDRSKSVTIRYVNKSGNTVFAGENIQISTDGVFEGYSHKFYYSAVSGGFSDMSGKTIPWINTFTSDKILLSVTLNEINGTSKIRISEVCGTVLSNDGWDSFKPFLRYEDLGGIKNAGETLTLSVPYAIDMLCPFLRSNFSLTVTTPSGKRAVSVDGVSLGTGCPTNRDYDLLLTESGKYRVTYSYVDAYGNVASSNFVANVSDTVPPTIILNGGYNKDTIVTASVNQKITVQGYEVSDDKTEVSDLVVKITVYSPVLEPIFVKDNSFTPRKTGVYTVYYYVYDTVGNYSVAAYKISVK